MMSDTIGLKKVIACYDELKNNGIKAEVYELDDEITLIDFLRNLDKTYDEISEEINVDSEDMGSGCHRRICISSRGIFFRSPNQRNTVDPCKS